MEAAKQNRYGHRDATAILVAYRHGLRASELVALRWDDIDLTTGRLHVRRAKGEDASVHPISARESRALRKLLREAPTSPHVFISERRAPLSAAGYQRMVARAGVAAKFTFPISRSTVRRFHRLDPRMFSFLDEALYGDRSPLCTHCLDFGNALLDVLICAQSRCIAAVPPIAGCLVSGVCGIAQIPP
jgi:integrase